MTTHLTILKKGLILISIPLLFQLAFIGLVARTQQMNAEAQTWANHSQEVLTHAHAVLGSVVDAQTGVRGFAATNDPVFLEAYERAVREFPANLERLQTLAQEDRTQRIAAKASEVLARQEKTAQLLRSGDRDQAVARIKTRDGKELMDDLRSEMAAFVEEGRRLDAARDEALQHSQQLLNWLLLAGCVVAFVSTGVVALIFSRGISGRISTLTANAQRLSRGEELAAPVTGTDEIARLDHVFHLMAMDLKRSEQALREQTRILQSVLDNMGDGVVVADEKGNFLVFNPAAERILGIGRTDTPPQEWSARYGVYLPDETTAYPPDDLPLTRAIRGEAVDDAELFIRHSKLSEGAWINVTGRPLPRDNGVLGGGVVVFRDVTGQKRAQEKIRNLNRELEERVLERTAELAEANRDLTHKNQENEMFVYSVSHDLRSPLVNLQGFSKELSLICSDLRAILTEHNLPPDVQKRGLGLLDEQMAESIRFIQTAVTRLSNIIDALLRLSRAGRVVYQMQRLDLNAIVGRIVDAMSGTLTERGARVTLEDLPPVWGDPTAVEQVFANLIGNALNYLDPRRPGVIEVGAAPAAEADGGWQTYYVKDNGLGIPEAYRHKVFQAFQRVHPQVAKGEGIGLAIVRRIVDRHHGKIWLESTPGEGTTFFVALPAQPIRDRAMPDAARLPVWRQNKEQKT